VTAGVETATSRLELISRSHFQLGAIAEKNFNPSFLNGSSYQVASHRIPLQKTLSIGANAPYL
jgi:hypothetical protein